LTLAFLKDLALAAKHGHSVGHLSMLHQR